MAHELAPLPYAHDALAPTINKRTMELHHGMHHAAYVKNLNAALEKHPALFNKSIDDLVKDLASVPDDIRNAVRNNGGGHWNHTLFWTLMGPNKGGNPKGEIAKAIDSVFGNFEAFKEKFNAAGVGQFGSGWVWLTLSPTKRLEIVATPNQDTPISMGHKVVLGNDVWEHAYYLTYENRRPEYLKSWWNVVNWDAVEARFLKQRG
jgi:superoxide dismutase, Fe-Mn family